MGGKDFLFLQLLALTSVVQGVANFAANLLQGAVQLLQLLVSRVIARVRWQLNPVQPEQWPADQPGGGADTLQHSGFGGRATRGDGYRGRGLLVANHR
ncbi:hypothetical protein D3C85_871240 [compost metagenome]